MDPSNIFASRCLYEILDVEPGANINEIKRSYYRLALKYHPDRVENDEKEMAKTKFNFIHQAYGILTDVETRKIYDENGSQVFFTKPTFAAQWESNLKTISNDELEAAKAAYQGSTNEESDIMNEIVNGKGSLTYLLNRIPFMRIEDETRISGIIRKLISDGKLPKMNIKKIAK